MWVKQCHVYHHVYRWYVYPFPVMGGLWHCFTHITEDKVHFFFHHSQHWTAEARAFVLSGCALSSCRNENHDGTGRSASESCGTRSLESTRSWRASVSIRFFYPVVLGSGKAFRSSFWSYRFPEIPYIICYSFLGAFRSYKSSLS